MTNENNSKTFDNNKFDGIVKVLKEANFHKFMLTGETGTMTSLLAWHKWQTQGREMLSINLFFTPPVGGKIVATGITNEFDSFSFESALDKTATNDEFLKELEEWLSGYGDFADEMDEALSAGA